MRQHFDINADTLEFCSATGSRIAQGASGLVLRYGESQELEFTVWKGGQKQVIVSEDGVAWELSADLDRRFTDEPMVGPISAAVENGNLVFAFDCNSEKFLAVANGRPASFLVHVQIARRAEGTDYYLMALAQAAGCVYDGDAEASRAVPHYYTKLEVDSLLAKKLESITVNGVKATVKGGTASVTVPAITAITVNGQTATVKGGTASVTVPAITEMVVNGNTASVSGGTARVTIPTGSDDAVEALDAMPTASAENARRVVLYSGTTTADYATGHQYRCDAETVTPTYRVAVNELAEATYGFDGVYEATDTPDEYVSHTGGMGKDSDVWLKRPDPSEPWGLYDVDGIRQYWLLDGGPAGTYDSADVVMPELWGTATVTEDSPGGETYGWTDITPTQTDAVTSVVVNGNTASVQGGTASVTVPAITAITVNGQTATVKGGTAAINVSVGGITDIVVNGRTASVDDGTASVNIKAVSAFTNDWWSDPTGDTGVYVGAQPRRLPNVQLSPGHVYYFGTQSVGTTVHVELDTELEQISFFLNGNYVGNGDLTEYACSTCGVHGDETAYIWWKDQSWRLGFDKDSEGLYWNDSAYAKGRYVPTADPPGIFSGAKVTNFGTSFVRALRERDDAISSITVNGQTVPVSNHEASITIKAISTIIVNGNTAAVSGGTATVSVSISGGTVTNNSITITDGGTSTTFLGMGTASVTGGVEIGKSISQGVTEIPAATSAYTLSEGCFEHTPSSAPTYTLPTVAADSRTHEIILTVKFSNVQTLAFVDSNGNTLTPQSTPTIAATSVITYLCRWSALASAWIIYPVVEVE